MTFAGVNYLAILIAAVAAWIAGAAWYMSLGKTWMAAQGIKWVFLPVTYMDEAPGYKEGWRDMTVAWRRENRYFRPVKILEIPNPRRGKLETVEIYYVCPSGKR